MKLGNKLYKYLSFNGFGTYIVIGIKIIPKCKLYEIECQSCHGHEKCTMYVVRENEKGKYKFVSMTNNDGISVDEYGDKAQTQHYWHDDDFFYSNLDMAKKEHYLKNIKYKKEQITKLEESLKIQKQSLLELEEHFNNIK